MEEIGITCAYSLSVSTLALFPYIGCGGGTKYILPEISSILEDPISYEVGVRKGLKFLQNNIPLVFARRPSACYVS